MRTIFAAGHVACRFGAEFVKAILWAGGPVNRVCRWLAYFLMGYYTFTEKELVSIRFGEAVEEITFGRLAGLGAAALVIAGAVGYACAKSRLVILRFDSLIKYPFGNVVSVVVRNLGYGKTHGRVFVTELADENGEQITKGRVVLPIEVGWDNCDSRTKETAEISQDRPGHAIILTGMETTPGNTSIAISGMGHNWKGIFDLSCVTARQTRWLKLIVEDAVGRSDAIWICVEASNGRVDDYRIAVPPFLKTQKMIKRLKEEIATLRRRLEL